MLRNLLGIVRVRDMAEAESVCDRVAMIDRGRLLALRAKLANVGSGDPVVDDKRAELDAIIRDCLGLRVRTLADVPEVVPGETLAVRYDGEQVQAELNAGRQVLRAGTRQVVHLFGKAPRRGQLRVGDAGESAPEALAHPLPALVWKVFLRAGRGTGSATLTPPAART